MRAQRIATLVVPICTMLAASEPARALVITPETGGGSATAAANALATLLLTGSSDFTLIPGSATYQGNLGVNANGGKFTGFQLAPTIDLTKPTFTLADGIVLSSSILSQIPARNSTTSFGRSPGSGASNLLSGIAPFTADTNDANVLSFKVSKKPGSTATSIKTTFLFMTEEFPTEDVTDIFGFFVDGTNFAKFADGSVVANQPDNASNLTNFTLNPVRVSGPSNYATEFNGLSTILQVAGQLNAALTEHQIVIGIADTDDSLFDSIAFITGLGGSQDEGGIIVAPPSDVIEPASVLLFAVGLLGLTAWRRPAVA